jgi:D-3-phosphoglycerate dehydrogenase
MSAWKILVTDGLEESGKAILRKSAELVENPTITADELLQVVNEYDALIVRGRTKVTPAVLAAGTKLKVVGRAGVGVDNIDLAAAKEQKITVVNSPLATTVSVAELTMGLMLSAIREIARVDAGLKAGKWLKKELEGAELYQKILGVIGFGRIGAAVAQRAKALENKVEFLYREALAELFEGIDDNKHVMKVFKYREVYRHLSNAADRGDEAANVIASIVMKKG